MWLKQSTACTITLGPFVDDTDGKTAETGLTISQADVRLRKNGGAAAQANESTSATHDENGYYSKPLNTTDTNTAGRLQVCVSESGALPVWHEFTVLPATIYDGLISGTLLDDVATSADISTEVFGFNVDGTITFKEITQIIAASVGGKVSGAPGSPVFRNLADDRNVITATVDSSGNRSSITYNPAG